MAEAVSRSSLELGPGGFEMLQVALRTARDRQIGKVSDLKAVVLRAFPGRELDLDAALRYWAAYEAEKRLSA